ncbi:MAG TPA: OmpA family protein [Byssovorax sp.]|jgi:outer membrane protein OmpA-like peptidoglycan-associated protein
MDPTLKVRLVVAFALAGAAPVLAACNDNRLPPNPVPRPDEQAALPRWYPEAPWSAREGQSRIFIEGKIVFDTDKATIRPGSSLKVLQTLQRFLVEHPEVSLVRVEGHTDNQASAEYNQELSARRALAVCDWLVDHGVDHTRLLAVGFGLTRPVAPNTTAAGRQENRRTEFHVAEVNGRLFQGKDPTAGGYSLIVKTIEERQREKELASKPVVFAKPKPFVPEGDVVKNVDAKPKPVRATPPPALPLPAEKKEGG